MSIEKKKKHRFAQMGEHQTTVREVAGQTGRTNTQGL